MAKEIIQERDFLKGEKFETTPEEMPEEANVIRYVMPKEAFGTKGTKVILRDFYSMDGGQTWREGGKCLFLHSPDKLDPKTGLPIQEDLAPFAIFGGLKQGGVAGVLHKAELEVVGSDTRFALQCEFKTARIEVRRT